MKKRLYLGIMFVAGIILVVVLAVVTVLFALGPGFDEGGPPGGRPGFSGPPPMLPGGIGTLGFLDLSKEQLDKIKEIVGRSFQETRDLRYELLQKELEIRKQFTDPKVDEATLLAKQKELSALRQKLMDKLAQLMIQGRRLLTPEQIQKLDQVPMGHGRMGFGMMDLGMFGPP